MTETKAPPMTSNRPYLIRAIYDWIVDNHQTPHLIVDARLPGVVVPPQAVRDGIVVLNISMTATGDLELGNDAIRFNARFSGVSRGVIVPVGAVLAIRSREQGLGMVFSPELFEEGEDAEAGDAAPAIGLAAVSEPADAEPEAVMPPATDPDRPKRGHLRVVK